MRSTGSRPDGRGRRCCAYGTRRPSPRRYRWYWPTFFGWDAELPLDLALVFGPTPPPATVLAGRSIEVELEPFEVLLVTATAGEERPGLQAVIGP